MNIEGIRDRKLRRLAEIEEKRSRWYNPGEWNPYEDEINELRNWLASDLVEDEPKGTNTEA